MSRRLTTVGIALLFLVTVVPTAALAEGAGFLAQLDPGQEVAPTPVVSDGSGVARFVSNETSVDFQLRWRNLTSGVIFAHIHCAARGVNGPVGVTLVHDPMAANDSVSGTFTGPDAMNNCGWVDLADVLGAMATGNAYVNVHTTMFPGGEIRGQIKTA